MGHTWPVLFRLLHWYAANSRPLPWREPTTSAWAVLVCEVMSQQTPVARVMPSWHEWMERWPEPADLAAASPAEVIVAWGNLGYPRRALRLRECAAAVAADWDGVLPSSRDDLLTLPGIGPYTADAIIAFSYRRRSVVLDTNTRRVLCRLHGTAAPPSHLRKDEIARADAMVPLEDDLAWQWNAALMELGALVCTAKNPACQECPLRPDCAWFAAGKPESGTPRRVQRFTGTHREARGKIMAVLRGAASPVSRDELAAAASLAPSRFDPALDSLLDDGLACLRPGGYALPEER